MGTNTDCEILQLLPVDSIVDKAKEMSGRDFDILVENDPFAGLVEKFPYKAFRALLAKARQNEFPKWAWDKFFNTLAHEKPQRKCERISIVVARHLLRYSAETLCPSIYAVVTWFRDVAETIRATSEDLHSRLWFHLAETISQHPEMVTSSIRYEDGVHDWSAESLNSLTGQLAETLFEENLDARVREKRVFPEGWLPRASKLLTLESIPLCHAIYIFGQRLRWFYWVDGDWTKNNLLSFLEDDSDQSRALLHGFLHSSSGVTRELFQELKPTLLELVSQMRDSNTHAYENLAEYMTLGWLVDDGNPNNREVSSKELHDLLLNSDRRFRACVVRRISRTVKTERDDGDLDNPVGDAAESRAIEFLKKVWPKHVALKTNDHFQDLFRLATCMNERFPEAADEIISLFRSAPDIRIHLYELLHQKSEIVDLHPNALAELVVEFLPEEKSQWPYDLGELLKRLLKKIDMDGDGSFKHVERLQTICHE